MASVFSPGLFQIHSAVLLFGLSGLFGKFLSFSPLCIVLGRTLFAAMALWAFSRLVSGTALTGFSRSFVIRLLFQGILLAGHWYCFFLSIQLSSVAIGLITFSTFPLFVTFLEPLVFKERLQKQDILLAVILFAGIWLVIPDPDLSNQSTLGGIFGILSGLSFAVLALLNRKNTRTADPIAVAFYQNSFAAVCLILPVAFLRPAGPSLSDLPALMFLGVVCTALAHTLFIASLCHIRAQTASVITGLEPVYGIILAFFLLGELPDLRTLTGGAIIIGTSLAAGYLVRSPAPPA